MEASLSILLKRGILRLSQMQYLSLWSTSPIDRLEKCSWVRFPHCLDSRLLRSFKQRILRRTCRRSPCSWFKRGWKGGYEDHSNHLLSCLMEVHSVCLLTKDCKYHF
jgi:hypothetical protein